MSGHQSATINDTVYFWFAANDTSGSGGDGATPLYDVREAGATAGAAPLLSGTPTLLTHVDYPAGCHEIAVAATTGNGFAADDTFAVYCTLAIDSQNPSGFVGSCTLTPVPTAAEIVNEWETQSQADPTGFHVNLLELAGDATPITALGDQYDGVTGLAGDTYPATQAQLSGIANVGSASHKPFAGETLTTPATTTGGSFTDTEALDEIYMYWDSVTGGFEAELTTNIGAGTPSGIKITGYMNGANDAVRIQMWDYQAGTPAWVTIGSWSGGGSTSNQVLPYDAFIGMVGIGANLGNVRLRLYNDNGVIDTALTNANIYIDQVFVEFSESAVSSLDAVYFDSGASNTGTSGIDGTPGNPVSTEAAVNTLLSNRNLNKVEVALESSITFATSHTNEIWIGAHWSLALGSQDVSGAHFVGADISGIGTGSVAIDFFKCRINTATIHPFHMNDCGFDGTLTLGAAGSYVISAGHSAIAGSITPIIDTGAAIANVDLAMPGYLNGIEIQNLNASGTDTFSISGIGQIIYAASSSGAVNQRGSWKVTNTGGVTITQDDPATSIIAIEVDTGTTLPATLGTPTDTDLATDIANSDAKLDIIDTNVDDLELGIIYGTAQTGTLSTTQATTDLSGYLDSELVGRVIIFTGGTADGQASDLTAYAAASGLVTFTALTTAPANNDTFKIV